ncbi:hypothetical protein [Cupriavidus metallidurans]|uniref:hypothetical protein n=1 Tax=Cupriavidus metallidurans TaxID=119219 RepID=UPI00131A03F3|nr:hypothetical protein [Cupriavidus metallidurans]
MSQNQANRQSAASNYQSNTQVNVNCSNCGSNWDNNAAAGFVAGAMVVGTTAAVASAAAHPVSTAVPVAAPPPPPAAPPCNVAPVMVSGAPYYQCGATWYTAGYGNTGVVYVPTQPPQGH